MIRLLTLFLSAVLVCSCSGPKSDSFQMLSSPAGENSHLPFLTTDASGKVFLSWVETNAKTDQSRLLYSKLTDTEWRKARQIAAGTDTLGWFVNWADYPSIVARDGGLIAAHVLKKIPGNTYAYNVNLFLREAGSAWSPPLTPHFDSTATEHGFASMAPWNDDILAIWLDGRHTHDRSEEEYFNLNKAMTLRSAVIGPDGSITKKKIIDASVCDCCNTAIAVTSEGVVAAYRNRTAEEIRDIYISRYSGGQWSDPEPVHNDGWKISACPVNGPALAANDSTIIAAWYTAAGEQRKVKAAISTNSGEKFSDPVVINDKSPIGHVESAMDKDGTAFVSWMENKGEIAVLKVKQISAEGEVSKPYIITEMNASRQSGFPQMELSDNRLVFAWTDVDSVTFVRTAVVEIER